MAQDIRVKRGTRAQVDAAAAANGLAEGEPYLITDESRLAIGTGTATYAAHALVGEGVTFEALDGNGDVGTGAAQVAAGNHGHATLISTDQKAALDAANTPSATNALATMDDVGSGGGGLTNESITADTDRTLEAGKRYLVNMTAWARTAAWTLPAAFATGAEIEIIVTGGCAGHELILQPAAGDSVNGYASGAVFTRLFQCADKAQCFGTVADTSWSCTVTPVAVTGLLLAIDEQAAPSSSWTTLSATPSSNRFGFTHAANVWSTPAGVHHVEIAANVEVSQLAGGTGFRTRIGIDNALRTDAVISQFQIPSLGTTPTLHNLTLPECPVDTGSTFTLQVLSDGAAGTINDFMNGAGNRNWLTIQVIRR